MVGFKVDLELPWSKHPFLFSKFKIRSQNDIKIIKRLGLKEVTVFPGQSDRKIALESQTEEKNDSECIETITNAQWQDKNSKLENADKYRKKRHSIGKKYAEQAKKIQQISRQMKAEPANAIHETEELVQNIATDFEMQRDLLTNLVNLGGGRHSLYNHFLNVTILSLMMAQAREITGEDLRNLIRGALLHDIGKVDIPSQILNKTTTLSKPEMAIYQKHPQYGRKLCELIGDVPKPVMEIIEKHHQYLDGTGFPKPQKDHEIPELVRIVSIANIYDNLCNPNDSSQAMTPKLALATLYSKFKTKLDHQLVNNFISKVGIYPPGSVVQLNDESIGLVVSVDTNDMMNPEVLLYNPSIPPLQAIIINLQEHDDLKVVNVLEPGAYPKRVYEYLGIQKRIGFMYGDS